MSCSPFSHNNCTISDSTLQKFGTATNVLTLLSTALSLLSTFAVLLSLCWFRMKRSNPSTNSSFQIQSTSDEISPLSNPTTPQYTSPSSNLSTPKSSKMKRNASHEKNMERLASIYYTYQPTKNCNITTPTTIVPSMESILPKQEITESASLIPIISPSSSSLSPKPSKLKKHQFFANITKICIFSMFFCDFLYCIIAVPINTLYLLTNQFYALHPLDPSSGMDISSGKALATVFVGAAELLEAIYMASTFWSFLITFSIFKTLQAMKQRKNTGCSTEYSTLKMAIYSILYHGISWGIPLITFAIWTGIFESSVWLGGGNNLVFDLISRLLGDMTKTLLYVVLESLLIFVRLLIFCLIRGLLQNHSAYHITSSKVRLQQTKTQMMKQILLYCIPFLICTTVLIVCRVVYNIDLLRRVIENHGNIDKDLMQFQTMELVLIAVNRIIFPLRGFLDALIYCYTSKWFYQNIQAKLVCCKTKNLHETTL